MYYAQLIYVISSRKTDAIAKVFLIIPPLMSWSVIPLFTTTRLWYKYCNNKWSGYPWFEHWSNNFWNLSQVSWIGSLSICLKFWMISLNFNIFDGGRISHWKPWSTCPMKWWNLFGIQPTISSFPQLERKDKTQSNGILGDVFECKRTTYVQAISNMILKVLLSETPKVSLYL